MASIIGRVYCLNTNFIGEVIKALTLILSGAGGNADFSDIELIELAEVDQNRTYVGNYFAWAVTIYADSMDHWDAVENTLNELLACGGVHGFRLEKLLDEDILIQN